MSIRELAETQGTQMSAALMQGLNTVSLNQTVTFNLYVQKILPLDGFVFWVRADLTDSPPEQALTLEVEGSLHYDSNQSQSEDETIAVQNVIFTTNLEVSPFNDLESQTMYLGCIDGFEFSFTARTMFYRQSGLYHYYGDAVYPAMRTQIINDATELINNNKVVSNSLPIWMSLNAIMPIYPAYLVPTNLTPPYAIANILEGTQIAVQPFPYIDKDSNHWQLVRESVKIVMYGLRNDDALRFLDYVEQDTLNTERFGIVNDPVVKDLVRTQTEINVRGQKKEIEFIITYYQAVANDVARKLILEAGITITQG